MAKRIKKEFTKFDLTSQEKFVESIIKLTEEVLKEYFLTFKKQETVKNYNGLHEYEQIEFSNNTDLDMVLLVKKDLSEIIINKIIFGTTRCATKSQKANGFIPMRSFSGEIPTNRRFDYYKFGDYGCALDINSTDTNSPRHPDKVYALYIKVLERQFACYTRQKKTKAEREQKHAEERALIDERAKKLRLYGTMHFANTLDIYNEYLEENYPELAEIFEFVYYSKSSGIKTDNFKDIFECNVYGLDTTTFFDISIVLTKKNAINNETAKVYGMERLFEVTMRYSSNGCDESNRYNFKFSYARSTLGTLDLKTFGLDSPISKIIRPSIEPTYAFYDYKGDLTKYALKRISVIYEFFKKFTSVFNKAFVDGESLEENINPSGFLTEENTKCLIEQNAE